MKKMILRFWMACILSSCCILVNAQVDLNNVLGKISGNSLSNDVVSALTSVFSSDKQASVKNIIGTWSYSEPAIVFQSDNVLAKAASKVAANKIEKKLQSYLTQYGIKPGTLTITFKEDGTFSETLNKKTINGKWTITNSKLQLTVSGIKTPAITTQINGNNLLLVTDATKLLNLFKTIGKTSNNSTLSTVTSLMKSVNGMQAGITLSKK